MKIKNDDAIKHDAGWMIFGIITGLLAIATTTGCTGIEVGGKLGVYRVDERQESQATHRRPVPLKCYFTSCEAADEMMPK